MKKQNLLHLTLTVAILTLVIILLVIGLASGGGFLAKYNTYEHLDTIFEKARTSAIQECSRSHDQETRSTCNTLVLSEVQSAESDRNSTGFYYVFINKNSTSTQKQGDKFSVWLTRKGDVTDVSTLSFGDKQ